MRSELDAIRQLFDGVRAPLRYIAPHLRSQRRRALPDSGWLGALFVAIALAMWLPTARAGAATPEELSRQYSADTLSELDEVLVPPGIQLVARARQITGRLAQALGDGDWKVLVFRMSEMPRHMQAPAFALPGKYIAVSDWVAREGSDDELAFMIGHEMGHVQLRHMDAIWRMTMSCAHVQTAKWTALAPYTDCAIPMMREQELEADTFGYALATNAGFNARKGAREVLDGLKADAMHPPSTERLKLLGIAPDGIQKVTDLAEIQRESACQCTRIDR